MLNTNAKKLYQNTAKIPYFIIICPIIYQLNGDKAITVVFLKGKSTLNHMQQKGAAALLMTVLWFDIFKNAALMAT